MSQDKGNDLRLDGSEAKNKATNTSPSESTLNTEIDKLLRKVINKNQYIDGDTSYMPDDALNEPISEIIKLVNRAIIGELKRYPPTAYRGDDYLGGFNDARRQLEERIKELEGDK